MNTDHQTSRPIRAVTATCPVCLHHLVSDLEPQISAPSASNVECPSCRYKGARPISSLFYLSTEQIPDSYVPLQGFQQTVTAKQGTTCATENDAIIRILTIRMEKCTREQLWCVNAIMLICAFVITESEKIVTAATIPTSVSAIASLAFYGILFVLGRHNAFYRNRDAVSELLKERKDAPKWLVSSLDRSCFNTISGVTFYSSLIAFSAILCALVLLQYQKHP